MLLDALLTSTIDNKLYVEDVFNTWLYTGNATTLTFATGVDLSSGAVAGSPLLQGGMIWTKNRTGTASSHFLTDTVRGTNNYLSSDVTSANNVQSSLITGVSTTGYTIGSGASFNTSGTTYASWTFRRAQKFFDVVTYTGTGSTRTIAHSLGVAPGMILIKRTDGVGNWTTYHRGMGNGGGIYFQTTSAYAAVASWFNNTDPTASVFTVGTSADVNTSGATYVAYIFAHDATADGIVQCGTFTADGSGNGSVNLGWEPGWMLLKTSSTASDWTIVDDSRYWTADKGYNALFPNLTSNDNVGLTGIRKNATGFSIVGTTPSSTLVYMCIRRGPMKTPTDATKVFQSLATTAASSSFALYSGSFVNADMYLARFDRNTSANTYVTDRLRGWFNSGNGSPLLKTNLTDAEATPTVAPMVSRADTPTSGPTLSLSLGTTSAPYVWHAFKRAPGFFDVVTYTGTGVTQTLSHNLGAAPKMMWVKRRDGIADWNIYHTSLGATAGLTFTTAIPTGGSQLWGNTAPTSTSFTVGSASSASGGTYIAYLFGDIAGVSKAGTYAGSGSDVTINCGFAPRFVLIKRTDTTGSWYIFDTARGIVAAADPSVLLDSTVAEGTSLDIIDPVSGGFTMVGSIAATNFAGGTYIYYAVA